MHTRPAHAFSTPKVIEIRQLPAAPATKLTQRELAFAALVARP